jgi:hypothetical protein
MKAAFVRVKYDVRNYKCCYSNSYVQTVTDIHGIKKKVQSGIETHNGCNCYAFSVFYLDVVDLGLNTYSLSDI